MLLNLNRWICQTFESRYHPLTPCGGLPHLVRHKKVTKMIEGRRSIAIGAPCHREYFSFETTEQVQKTFLTKKSVELHLTRRNYV